MDKHSPQPENISTNAVPDAAPETAPGSSAAVASVRPAPPEPIRKKRKKKKKWIIPLVIVVVVVLALFYFSQQRRPQIAAQDYSYDTVQQRTITVILNGKGTLQPADSYSVTSLVRGEIVEAPFEEGDFIEKGALLYQVDTGDVENNIRQSQINLDRSQLGYDDALRLRDDLNIVSDTSGVVTGMYVKVGDPVMVGARIAEVRDSSAMLLKIPFNSNDIPAIFPGQQAKITVDSSFEVLHGTVTEISAVQDALAGNMLVQTVTIRVENPGAITDRTMATAVINGIACNSPAAFEYAEIRTVTAAASGEVQEIVLDKGSPVRAGDIIARLSDDNLDSQIKNSELALNSSRLSLDSAKDMLDDYRITSPISGTVVEKNYKAGDTLNDTAAVPYTAMAIIYDLSTLKFEMKIDELDIAKITVGQRVSVTADALEDRVFEGTVSKININGTSVNGVTSYPATVVIEETDGLLPGMNVKADIVVEQKANVPSIPVGAVMRGDYVYVDSNSASAKSGEVAAAPAQESGIADRAAEPEGYTKVKVKLGANDDHYIEILSGLQPGDKIAYKEANAPIVLVNPITGEGMEQTPSDPFAPSPSQGESSADRGAAGGGAP